MSTIIRLVVEFFNWLAFLDTEARDEEEAHAQLAQESQRRRHEWRIRTHTDPANIKAA